MKENMKKKFLIKNNKKAIRDLGEKSSRIH
jgi:hypothetical protein